MRKAKLKHLLVALMVCCTLPLLAGGEAPANDLCSGAIEVTCGDVIEGTTFDATFDGVATCPNTTNPPPVDVTNTAPGVWYSLSGTSGDVTFSTCNDAGFDTKITVFSGSCEGGLTCEGANDDGTGCSGFTSEVTVSTEATKSYLILVHGFGSATGNFNLTVSGTCLVEGENDDCAGAIPIKCGETVSGSTLDATDDDIVTCGTTYSPGVWYSFVGEDGSATLSTCDQADYDTKISVYTGSCGALTCVDENDDDFANCSNFTSQLTVPTTAGTTYYVFVNGFFGVFGGPSVGNFDLTLTCTPPASGEPNDDCVDAVSITCGDVISGSTANANIDAVTPCNATPSPGVWYSYTAGTEAAVSVSTCSDNTDYDTYISVYVPFPDCDNLFCLGGVDDDPDCPSSSLQTTVTVFGLSPGTELFFFVHGFFSIFSGPSQGDFELTVSCLDPVPNDFPCDAETLALGAITPFHNFDATADPGEVNPGPGTGSDACDSQDGWCDFFGEPAVENSLWWTFEAPASGAVSVTAESFDLQLAVWTADDCADYSTFSEVGANDDGNPGGGAFDPQVNLYCLNPGATYYVQLDGFNGESGQGTIIAEALPYEPLTCDAGGCQTKFVGYEPAEGLNYLIASAGGGISPYTYAWSGDGIVGADDVAHITVDPTETTTYTVTVTDAVGCTTECSVEVTYMDVTCGRNGDKITVCHAPDGNPENVQQLCLGYAAVATHLDHEDDLLGYCGNTCLNTNPPPAECVELSVSITTDRFASETSWVLLDGNGFEIARGERFSLTNETTTVVFEDCVDPGCYEFTIFDSFGDGICCAWGDGTYSVTYDGVTTVSPTGGTFGVQNIPNGNSETITVGDCDVTRVAAPAVKETPDNDRKLLSKVSVYPNPLSTSARIFVVPAKDADAVIDILDLSGRLIATLYDGAVTRGQTIDQEINSSLFGSNGIYMYRVQIGDETFVDKIVVNK